LVRDVVSISFLLCFFDFHVAKHSGRSIIPPPPAYQGVSTYGNPGIPVTVVPPIEKNNTFSRPTGPEYQFLAGEGMSRRDQSPISQAV
jgi:hypothetical protein